MKMGPIFKMHHCHFTGRPPGAKSHHDTSVFARISSHDDSVTTQPPPKLKSNGFSSNELTIWQQAIRESNSEALQHSLTMRIHCVQCRHVCTIIPPCTVSTTTCFLFYVCTEVAATMRRQAQQQDRARRQRIDDEPRLHVIPNPALEATIKVEEEDENDNTPTLIYPF